MATGTLTFDSASPACGAQVRLTVAVDGFSGQAISLQVSPDPGDGSNGQVVTFDDPASPSKTLDLTAGAAGTTFTYTLLIDGQPAVDAQGAAVTATLTVQAAPAPTTTQPAPTTPSSSTCTSG